MARRAGPSARSRKLARSLRRIRAENGASAAEVGKATDMSGSKINRIETAEIGIYQDDLEKLLDYYRLSKKRRVELLDIARNAEQRSWLRLHNAHLPSDWQTWGDFEDEATALLQFEPMMVPGLLQTAEYARSVVQGTGSGLTANEVDALVASRMSRQAEISKADPLDLHVVIEEAVLARPFGGDEALVRQLKQLVDLASRPNITLQVLPSDVGLHPGMYGAFVVLEYDNDPSMVWLENSVASVVFEEDDQIGPYVDAWNVLASLACTPEASIDLLTAKLD